MVAAADLNTSESLSGSTRLSVYRPRAMEGMNDRADDRTSVRTNSHLFRGTVGAGPMVSVHSSRTETGLDFFVGGTIQVLHSANSDAVILTALGTQGSPPVEDSGGASATGLAIGGQLGLVRRYSRRFGGLAAVTALHQQLHVSGAPWILHIQVGVVVSLR